MPQSSGNHNDEIVRAVVKRHIVRCEPDVVTYLGVEFTISPNVFSPFIAPSGAATLAFASQDIFRGKKVLDIGCGAGVFTTAALLAGANRAVGVDLNQTALDNANQNAKAAGVHERMDLRQGNLFDGVKESEKYDIIYADLPFCLPIRVEGLSNDLSVAFFDPELATVTKYISSVSDHLTENGKAYICLSNLDRGWNRLKTNRLRRYIIIRRVDIPEMKIFEVKR